MPGEGIVIVTTSPIPSHPSTAIIDRTLTSIRERVNWPIVVVADGVRPELEHRRAAYDEYLDRLAAAQGDEGFLLISMDGWVHQAGAVQYALDSLGPYAVMLFAEHDTPLVGALPATALVSMLLDDGMANVVRLYHEKVVQPEHAALFSDAREACYIANPYERNIRKHAIGPLFPTRQWSQRPHFARCDYYRFQLATHFPGAARTMIEDKMHSVVETEPWEQHRVWLYLPDDDGSGLGVQRSDHLDGRGDDPKFEMRFA